MKFSERWLRSWVPDAAPTEELCERLSGAGLEVDGAAEARAEFSGVVAAVVVSVEPHPAADRLSVCEVDAGGGSRTVVCGAPNVWPGMVCPYAAVGAVLPGGVEIRHAEVRGVASDGMLCSADELGLGRDADGIMELDGDMPPGDDLREALDLPDVVIDLDLTPNRGDCLSIRGIAREVALLCDAPLTAPRIEPVPATCQAFLPVAVDEPAGCPRYLGRVIEDVDVSRPAPLWLRERLRRCGLRSIDPVVDVTNYVLLELGQPMHAFDLDQLQGGIRVRNASAGESLAMLDGSEVSLDPTTLLITDDGGPVAIAGVMGGERSGVAPATRNVFLECAFFAPATVAATARRFGMRTDASHRYERGVDSGLQHEALHRATRLLLDIVGGRAGPIVEAASAEHLPTASTVSLRKARLDLLVGEPIPVADVTRVFRRLELAPKAVGSGDETVWTVTPPSHRFDIAREEDLVEEVLRVHGYNAVASRLPATAAPLGRPPADRLPESRLADRLAALGYAEAVTYSFVPPVVADLLDPGGEPLRVVNPVSEDHAAMRTNLLPGLTAALSRNLARRADRVRLFEIGQCFRRGEDGGAGEQMMLCGGIAFGPREAESWAHDGGGMDFFDLKGDVENVLALGGREVAFERAEDPVLHPGQSALARVAGEPAGRLGRLHPEVEAALDLPAGVFVFELQVRAVLASRRPRHRSLSLQPAVRRDLAVVVDRDVDAARIETAVRRRLGAIVVGCALFDVYTGEGVAAEDKSVAIGLTLQHGSRTLREAEINEHVEDALDALATELGARLR